MKLLIIAFALIAGSSASATINCADQFGNQATISQVSTNIIRLDFNNNRYPASGHLSYSGERSASYYYRGNGKLLEVEKSVISGGQGTVWYHFRDEDRDRSNTVVRLSCH